MSGLEIAALAAGSAGSAVAALQGARSQAGIQTAQAVHTRQAGHNAVLEGEAAAAKAADDGRRQRARMFNGLAGSGVDPQSGSADDILSDLAAGSALDASVARWRGTQAAATSAQRAGLLDFRAGATMREAWWRTGSTLLTSGGRLMARTPAPQAGELDGMF